MTASLLWHDYETFGADPKRDRPAQFAALRTDLTGKIMGEPIMMFCQPAEDLLPDPIACLITGISPQMAHKKGVPEAVFMQKINEEMLRPQTCSLGYNSLRFDDEITRFGLYRNLYDPYEREWKNNNSRWDIIDLFRACFALRPEAISWPKSKEGVHSFRLQDLARANHIDHENAHDALADVRATLALAKLLREKKPKLFAYCFSLRKKDAVKNFLNKHQGQPFLHTSGMYGEKCRFTALVVPLAQHPTNPNGIIVYNLSTDPEQLIHASIVKLREYLYATNHELGTMVRPALKTLHINRCPFLVTQKLLENDLELQKRTQIDRHLCLRNYEKIKNADLNTIGQKVQKIMVPSDEARELDADIALYSEPFFNRSDRQLLNQALRLPSNKLATFSPQFNDQRLKHMLLRFKARNYPHILSEEEKKHWHAYCKEKLTSKKSGYRTFDAFFAQIKACQEQQAQSNKDLLTEVAEYGMQLAKKLEVTPPLLEPSKARRALDLVSV